MKKRQGFIIPALILMALVGGGCNFLFCVEPIVGPAWQSVEIDEETGCALAEWTVTVADPSQGAVTSVASWQAVVDYGDGSEQEEFTVWRGRDARIEHCYTALGTYTITVRQGQYTSRAVVEITVLEPIVRRPFYLRYVVERWERIDFQVSWREVGCESTTGKPLYETGITPGAGLTEFRIEGYDWQGRRISLFDQDGVNVWGQWVSLITDIKLEAQAITCWALWYSDTPRVPMVPTPHPSGCVPDDPWEDPPIPEDARWMVFKLWARNPWLLTEDDYPMVQWRIAVTGWEC